jgi:membrane protein DedA with SNARE-associated domain
MTVIGGASKVPLLTFFVGAVIGRSLRFFAVGTLFYIWGPPMKTWLERYLERIVLAITALVVLFLAVYIYWSHS